MDYFGYREGDLFCEETPVATIAEQVGTPVYIYSGRTLREHYARFAKAFAPIAPEILYSVKSCNNLSLLRLLAECGAGMDVVSGGELFRALKAGVPPEKIVFAGVGKCERELAEALDARIGWLNAESEEELEAIERLARARNVKPRVAIRLNPDVIDPRTHRNTATGGRGSKFGIDLDRAPAAFERFGRSSDMSLEGLHFHLGSPIYSADPYVTAIGKALDLVEIQRARGFVIDTLDIGGGFMAEYDQVAGRATDWDAYAGPIVEALRAFVEAGGRVLMEPGRTICANAGLLLTQVLYRKLSGNTQIAVVDTGMHHLIRPALYDAEQFMWPARVSAEHVPHRRTISPQVENLTDYDVVGPICESTDRLARARALPPLAQGDRLGIFSVGAYGMVMASQYNAVPRPAEVLVDGASFRVIRRRESYDDLVAAELDGIGG